MNNGSRDFQREKELYALRDKKPGLRRTVSFEFSAAAYEKLAEMIDSTSSDSKADVVRKALRLLEWYQNRMNAGYNLCLKKGNEVQVIELEF